MGFLGRGAQKNIEIDPEKCRGCGACLEVCARGVLEYGDGENSRGFTPVRAVHPENCVRCSLCAVLCNEKAILIKR